MNTTFNSTSPTQSPTYLPLINTISFSSSIDNIIYYALAVHLFLVIVVIVLTELVKYHILDKQKTQVLINTLTKVVNEIPKMMSSPTCLVSAENLI